MEYCEEQFSNRLTLQFERRFLQHSFSRIRRTVQAVLTTTTIRPSDVNPARSPTDTSAFIEKPKKSEIVGKAETTTLRETVMGEKEKLTLETPDSTQCSRMGELWKKRQRIERLGIGKKQRAADGEIEMTQSLWILPQIATFQQIETTQQTVPTRTTARLNSPKFRPKRP
jgi:hypothetical protein